MLYRNFLAMETEELIRLHPIDGVVLMGGCDKTTPALLMGAFQQPASDFHPGRRIVQCVVQGQKVGAPHAMKFWNGAAPGDRRTTTGELGSMPT